MATLRLKIFRIAAISSALIAAGAAYLSLQLGADQPPKVALVCTGVPPDIHLIGPALTVDQVEGASLAEMKSAPPSVPRVPFGFLNNEWASLKGKIKPGDALYKYQTGASGGYVVLRNRCVVGQIMEWIS